jgi:chloramphenicol 3-O-phosphotransferase
MFPAQAAIGLALAFVGAVAGIVLRVGLNVFVFRLPPDRCYNFEGGGFIATILVIVLTPAVVAALPERPRRAASIAMAVLAALTASFIWSSRRMISCAPL